MSRRVLMRQLLRRAKRVLAPRRLTVWHDAGYRLPLPGIEGSGFEPRRADLVWWFLLDRRLAKPADLRPPPRIAWSDLARVHDPRLLESLTLPESLAQIYAVDAGEIPVDAVLGMVRLACGATLAAARETLRTRVPALNLLGGFHHAFPDRAGGFCPVNDVAVAIAALRAEGFTGRIAVLDLDAHPPDGTAACLRLDPAVWIGSISGSDWGPLPGVDETLLAPGSGDRVYLDALQALLKRMPEVKLAFVLAGGDVLKGDAMGLLALTLDGVRQRDLRVARALAKTPAVWLPAGGYSAQAWKSLAGTAMAVARRSRRPIPALADPLNVHFARLSRRFSDERLSGDDDFGFSEEDLAPMGRRGPEKALRLLDYYTAEGIEYALFRFGILEHLQRLGYTGFRVALARTDAGDRLRLYGSAGGKEHLVIESVLDRKRLDGGTFLFVNWTLLQNPRAKFTRRRLALPGQQAPGLGLAREAAELYALMAKRLHLDGVAFRPSWMHMAWSARNRFVFAEPGRQGRWEALLRDLKQVPLTELTAAVAEGRVRMNGEIYVWEADDMLFRLSGNASDRKATAKERGRVRFTLDPAAPRPSDPVNADAAPGG